MTKEEILDKRNWSSEYPNYMAEFEIHAAMDEYAKQQCIAFAEWMNDQDCQMTPEGWVMKPDYYGTFYITSELHEKFLTETSI